MMLQFLLSISEENNHDKIVDIYNKYHDYMMRYAITRFQAKGIDNFFSNAEDAVQNTFMKITRYIDNIDFSRGENDVKNYCLTILSSEICNLLSDKEDEEFNDNIYFDHENSFVEEFGLRERYQEVVRAIEGLDEKYSTTLYLVFCKEMTPKEIAKIMGISVKTVYTRIARGKKLLSDSLKGAMYNG